MLQGEFEHRRVKRFYRSTNKTHTFTGQIGNLVQREHVLNAMATHVDSTCVTDEPSAPKRRKIHVAGKPKTRRPTLVPSDDIQLGPASPDVHFQISVDPRNKVEIDTFLDEVGDDPAYEVRVTCLVY